jgi:hypothetical protein
VDLSIAHDCDAFTPGGKRDNPPRRPAASSAILAAGRRHHCLLWRANSARARPCHVQGAESVVVIAPMAKHKRVSAIRQLFAGDPLFERRPGRGYLDRPRRWAPAVLLAGWSGDRDLGGTTVWWAQL